ncbi:branched-chain amino acid ABC transporter permease [Paractinoplanes deccanensis]|uniref:Branched-chain amino acid ABC transporter permease n=1 Tax=Paractinoplanes deccanensis TaxID=113561 RepID=A0ABQ3XXA1_9ACTN|nr:branched-chain amino acid ABC transporter permease [Actinoplanes deccanensis]GID72292.1 branched-chain amino acid ABC transporter permease [Actinoplanes deccanensis]
MSKHRTPWKYGAFVVLLLLVPVIFTRSSFLTMSTAVLMVLLAIGALGLVPLTGLAQQVSLGQAAFYGIGGYTSAILTTRHHVGVWWAMLAGAVVAGGVAWLLGLIIFRVQGHYLALATLAFGLTLAALANELPFTGRSAGIAGLPPLHGGDLGTYYLFAGILLAAMIGVDLLIHSRLGKSLTAAGDSPIAAAASGIDIGVLRRTAFVVAAVLASVAGSGYAHWYRFVDPSMLGLLNSVELLIIVSVGGRDRVWGAPLGAFVVISLTQVAKDQVGGGSELTAYGIALIVSLLLLPHGLAGWRRR